MEDYHRKGIMNRILFIDTETGGVNPNKHSLLSVGLVVWDASEGIVYSNEMFIKSKEYVVTNTAQRINHFNPKTHDENSIEPKEFFALIEKINKQYFQEFKGIPLGGHNTQFDIGFIRKLYEDNGRSYEKIFSHRVIDTYSILKFLCDSGKLHLDYISSAKAFTKFGIVVNGRHTALGDAIATAQLYEQMILLVKNQVNET